MDIHFCYLHSINHPQFGKPFFFWIRLHHHQDFLLLWMT
jgi:hypothetical protein